MRYGKFLPEGGTIGFVAPSFGCNIEPYKSGFESAQKKFKDMGYQIQIGPNCYEGCGIGISNTPEKCGQEINEYYCSKENDILISCGGGELMCEVLNHIDFEALKKAEPKWYTGYSDNTNLTFLLPTLCDVAAVYGPCAPAYGMDVWHPALRDAFECLTGEKLTVAGYDKWEKESLKDEEHPTVPYNTTESRVIHSFQGAAKVKTADFSGRLIGGCLDCLANLVGTQFDKVQEFTQKYQEDGFVWFLESCDLNVLSIRRAIWQLDNAGWFKYVKGFLIGRPLVFGQEIMGLNQYQAVTELLGKYQVPVIMDVDLGHLPPMMPIICGSVGKVSVKGNDVRIEMALK